MSQPIWPSVASLHDRGKDIAMKTQNASRNTPDRTGSAFVVARSRTSDPRSASVHLLDSSTRPGQHRSFVQNTQTPSALRNQMADFLVEVDGLPVVVRFL